MSLRESGDLFLAAMYNLHEVVHPYDQLAALDVMNWANFVREARDGNAKEAIEYEIVLEKTFAGIDHYLKLNASKLTDETFNRAGLFLQDPYYDTDVLSPYHLPIDRILRIIDAQDDLGSSIWVSLFKVFSAKDASSFEKILNNMTVTEKEMEA